MFWVAYRSDEVCLPVTSRVKEIAESYPKFLFRLLVQLHFLPLTQPDFGLRQAIETLLLYPSELTVSTGERQLDSDYISFLAWLMTKF